MIISRASSPLLTPPVPMIGTSTARARSYTQRTAMGRIAGPETPPTRLARTGCPLSRSITMPGPRVLIAVRASAPAATTAWAMAIRSGVLAESLTVIGIEVAARTARVTAAAVSASRAKGRPNSAATLGHEMLTSIRSGAAALTCRATSAKPSTVSANTLAIRGTASGCRSARVWRRISTSASTPGLASPTALISPGPQSSTVGLGCPARGRGPHDFVVMPPAPQRATRAISAASVPRMPEASTSGLGKVRLQNETDGSVMWAPGRQGVGTIGAILHPFAPSVERERPRDA